MAKKKVTKIAKKKVKKASNKSVKKASNKEPSIAPSSKKKKVDWIVALLLSIFLGFLGIDRFYMGKLSSGILKLLISILSMGLLSWIWWIADIILIATKYDYSDIEWI